MRGRTDPRKEKYVDADDNSITKTLAVMRGFFYAQDCEMFGAQGITVHPRPDERHIRYQDVRLLKPLITTEFNIEGNPIPSFSELVLEVKPKQVTLVPDGHDQLTSNHGWDTIENRTFLTDICRTFREAWVILSV